MGEAEWLISIVCIKVGTVFLGFEKGPKKTPVFSAVIKQDLHKTLKEEDEDWEWKNVLSEGPRMSKVDGALMSAVNGMMEFHLKNLKCGKTGTNSQHWVISQFTGLAQGNLHACYYSSFNALFGTLRLALRSCLSKPTFC